MLLPRGVLTGGFIVVVLATTGCATIAPGHAGVLTTARAGVQPQPLGEGMHLVSPLSRVDDFDLRAQERNEDLIATSSDGVPIQARTSLVTYSIVPGELVALDRELGPGYYDVIVRPIVRSTVRRVLGAYRADALDTPTIRQLQAEATALAAARMRPYHVILEAIDMRTLQPIYSAASYQPILDAGVLEQQVLATPQKLEVARRRGDERREQARAIANGHARVAPTLTPLVLDDERRRAEEMLLAAPSTTVITIDRSHPTTVEVAP
jgi:regulator of protease activity HflC (stomatin/prohibitin superfamily)